ncbi:MAG TPA: peptidase, partial [Burkholderiaceae bacterium]|nr:peptidase [Burkholderiaceae bacterium]
VLQTAGAQQSALAGYLAASIARLPKSARLPLLDLAMPALRQLPEPARVAFLATVEKVIAADRRVTLAEFVLQTVLTRRLNARAGRATPIKFAHLAAIRRDCALLLSLVAHVAASASAQMPKDAFLRGAAYCPELGLTAAGLTDAAAIGFGQVRVALERANQLAPLVKPVLIKTLVAVAGEASPLPVDIADVLRAICAALEAPIPPAVAATYTACRWDR